MRPALHACGGRRAARAVSLCRPRCWRLPVHHCAPSTGWSRSSRASVSASTSLDMCCHTQLSCRFWGLNSGPHGCMSNAFLKRRLPGLLSRIITKPTMEEDLITRSVSDNAVHRGRGEREPGIGQAHFAGLPLRCLCLSLAISAICVGARLWLFLVWFWFFLKTATPYRGSYFGNTLPPWVGGGLHPSPQSPHPSARQCGTLAPLSWHSPP